MARHYSLRKAARTSAISRLLRKLLIGGLVRWMLILFSTTSLFTRFDLTLFGKEQTMADKNKVKVEQNAQRIAQWLMDNSAEFEQQGINESRVAAAAGLSET